MKALLITQVFVAASVLIVTPARSHAQRAATDPAVAGQDSLLAQREHAQWEALKARDTTTFARLMGDGIVDVDLSGIKRTSPASTAQYVLGCRTVSYAMSDLRVTHVDKTATVTYKAIVDATCWGQKAPSPLYVLTVYAQRGDGWFALAHSETPAARQ